LPDIARQGKLELGSQTISLKQDFLEKMKSQVKLSPPILRAKAETVMSHYLKYPESGNNANIDDEIPRIDEALSNKNPYKSRQTNSKLYGSAPLTRS
jgi:hypothetical protein